MESSAEKVHERLGAFINKILFMGKRNIFEFRGLKLYPSEIHLILVMNEAPTNASQMAQRLNVTKGAVSQTISRLVKKEILVKTKDPYLKNELTLTFTPLGKEVFHEYRQISRTVEGQFLAKISRFDPGELEIVERFLDEILEVPDTISNLPGTP